MRTKYKTLQCCEFYNFTINKYINKLIVIFGYKYIIKNNCFCYIKICMYV